MQNINICPADNLRDSNYVQNRNEQNQNEQNRNEQNRNELNRNELNRNNYPQDTQNNYRYNNSHLSHVAFGKELPDTTTETIPNITSDNSDNTAGTIREPLPLPSKPPVNSKKNNQLSALKNSLINKPTPQFNSPSVTTSANYNRSPIEPNPVKLVAADTINEHNNSSDLTPNNQSDYSDAKLNSSDVLPELSDNSTAPINVTENQKTQNNYAILDQKLNISASNDKTGKLKKIPIPEFITPIASVIGSLLIVISIFLILVLLFRKISPNANQYLPKEVFENLGKTFLTQKLQVYLLRLGNRLILVSASGNTITPITEITDTDEVVTVLGMCRSLNNNAINKFHKNLSNQLNSNSGSHSKKSATKNNRDDYFGTNQTEYETLKYNTQRSNGIDMYSEPDNSLAAILASGIERKGVKT
ncbi:MAG: hypothetical protein LBE18_07755 [Planctomycetaceae bacterium]|nr:hypothetical protein [Planctomycetaceae bacterium]